ncbi:MAG: DUF1289 domain-containing protein [Gammaproteobacteria bacterium]|nr:DUF1289 domain-containing protein [Gammaproteobacteria bacterium]
MAEAFDAVESPCVRNCCLDDDGVCMGCFRSVDEITGWAGGSEAFRRAVLARAAERKAAQV